MSTIPRTRVKSKSVSARIYENERPRGLLGARKPAFSELRDALTGGPRGNHLIFMTSRRFSVLALSLGAFATLAPARAAAESTPQETVQALCDALISAMKQGPTLGYSGRRHALEPEIRKALNLPLMTRLVMGPPWRTLTAEQQQQMVEAFSDYSIATYANRFSSYSGERFTVDSAPTRLASGDVIVHSQLKTGDPEPVRLDYLMREGDGRWQVIDVFLSGTISELAARRSEFSSVLRRGGTEALIDLLRKKVAELSG
jgi:phospholipid transport system substrate-binding protein